MADPYENSNEFSGFIKGGKFFGSRAATSFTELFALEEFVSKRRKALVFAITVNCVLSRQTYDI
jgi:hypothetical protein